MKRYFISYTSSDENWAEWIAWQLEASGEDAVLQKWDFRPGSNFAEHMNNALLESDQTIAVLSPAYLESAFAAPEWQSAFTADPRGNERRLVPVKVLACELGGLLRSIVHIDLVEETDERVAKVKLLDGLRHTRSKPSNAPLFPGSGGQSLPQKPPFPGSGIVSSHSYSDPQATKELRLDPVRMLEQRGWGDPDLLREVGGYGVANLQALVVPSKQDEQHIDELEFGPGPLRDWTLQHLLNPPSAIFSTAVGTEPQESSNSLIMRQKDREARNTLREVEIFTDGSLSLRQELGPRDKFDRITLSSYVINEEFNRVLDNFLKFADRLYGQLKLNTGDVLVGVSLANIGSKFFGHLPKEHIGSFTFSTHQLDDPLRVPPAPLRVSREALSNSQIVAGKLAAHLTRAFRIVDSYRPAP